MGHWCDGGRRGRNGEIRGAIERGGGAMERGGTEGAPWKEGAPWRGGGAMERGGGGGAMERGAPPLGRE